MPVPLTNYHLRSRAPKVRTVFDVVATLYSTADREVRQCRAYWLQIGYKSLRRVESTAIDAREIQRESVFGKQLFDLLTHEFFTFSPLPI